MKRTILAATGAAAVLLLAQSAQAGPTNQPPPAGTVIYQLTGQTILGTYSLGTATFTAGTANTDLTFAFREDPAFIDLSDVTMTDLTTGAPVVVVNGDFSLGPVGSSAPTGWSYLIPVALKIDSSVRRIPESA